MKSRSERRVPVSSGNEKSGAFAPTTSGLAVGAGTCCAEIFLAAAAGFFAGFAAGFGAGAFCFAVAAGFFADCRAGAAFGFGAATFFAATAVGFDAGVVFFAAAVVCFGAAAGIFLVAMRATVAQGSSPVRGTNDA